MLRAKRGLLKQTTLRARREYIIKDNSRNDRVEGVQGEGGFIGMKLPYWEANQNKANEVVAESIRVEQPAGIIWIASRPYWQVGTLRFVCARRGRGRVIWPFRTHFCQWDYGNEVWELIGGTKMRSPCVSWNWQIPSVSIFIMKAFLISLLLVT